MFGIVENHGTWGGTFTSPGWPQPHHSSASVLCGGSLVAQVCGRSGSGLASSAIVKGPE